MNHKRNSFTNTQTDGEREMKEEICRKNICLGNGQEIQARKALKKGEMTEKEMWNRERNKKEKERKKDKQIKTEKERK